MGHPEGTKNRMRSAEEKADLIERFKPSAVSEKEFEAEKGSLNRFSGSGFGNTSPAASRALPNLFRFSQVFAST